jgi:hypothetical protein
MAFRGNFAAVRQIGEGFSRPTDGSHALFRGARFVLASWQFALLRPKPESLLCQACVHVDGLAPILKQRRK